MIATAVRDGDGVETRASHAHLQMSSKTRRFHPRSWLAPISGILPSASPLLARPTLYQVSSAPVGYFSGPYRDESIRLLFV